MIQLLQSLSSGRTELIEVPVPRVSGRNLLIQGHCSLVSAGTERMLVEFGRANLINKARAQPERAAQVLNKIRTDGLLTTLEAVRSKLETPIPLGYCHTGVVVEIGRGSVPFRPGDRVVSNGNHAEYVVVPWTLSAKIPANVSFDAAAFTPVAAIALQGMRLAQITLGETVVVYGLGLIGLLTVQLLRANGCRVIGIDVNAERLMRAEQFGAETFNGADGQVGERVLDATRGVGADAILLTLASSSDEPVREGATMSRKRGRIVLVGVTGLNLRREDFYTKELTFSVSSSYGPGRYDPKYEQDGADYPLAYVRWTAQRNFEAILQLMASGALDPLPLVTHRFPFSDAQGAYNLITSKEPSLGVILRYENKAEDGARHMRVLSAAEAPASQRATPVSVGVIGAGNFGARVLMPALAARGVRLRGIASSRGTSAAVVGRRFGFERVTSDASEVLADDEVTTAFILTRHDSHASLALRALQAGKHVFVEKPLALTEAELDQLEVAVAGSGLILTVGFNRRFAPLARALHSQLQTRSGPASLLMTINAGAIPRDHWTQNPEIGGGRIVGEACHFLDLARFLIGSRIVDVQVVSASANGLPQDDIAHVTIAFEDGSTAAVHYLAHGSKAFPKERIEAFAEGRAWRIDNWRRLVGFGAQGQGHRFGRVAKGHREELTAFVAAVERGGPPPIPHEQIFEISRWAIRAARLARAEGQSRSSDDSSARD